MLRPLCLTLLAGLLPLCKLASVPSASWLLLCLAGGLFLLTRRLQAVRLAGYGLLAFCWGCFVATQSLSALQHMPVKPAEAEFSVVRSTGSQACDAKMVSLAGKGLFPQPGVRLYGARLPGTLYAGQRLRATVRLRPVHGQLNEGTFDSQRFYMAQRLLFTGRIVSAAQLSGRGSLQARWQAAVQRQTAGLSAQGVIMALLFGERQSMPDRYKTLLARTGTAHLMAISGMHISLAAGFGWLVARACQFVLPAARIGYRFPLFCSVAVALGYTWLSGGNPPAQRAICALLIWSGLKLSGRRWSAWDVWLVCVTVIALQNPLILLSDSFRLSALAVAALIFWYQWVPLPDRVRRWPCYLRYPVQLAHLQIGVMILLLPLQTDMFHGLSLSSFAANLVAVPVVSFLVLPLLFFALLLAPFLPAAERLWQVADLLITSLMRLLAALPEGWLAMDKRWIWLSFVGWIAVIIWRVGAWQHYKILVLSAAGALMLSLQRAPAPPGQWQMTMLDIGHGLAVALVRNHHVLLYDTGGIWRGGDAAERTIIPWLKWHGLTLDAIVISHEHLDHTGGLASLQRFAPGVSVRSSLGWKNHLPCHRGIHWQWEGLQFVVQWPPPAAGLTGNNNSCVVRVDDGTHRLLLTGDLEASAELAMLSRGKASLQADFIQVPHHGSRTSSTEALLKAVAGRAAFASTSRYNQWRFPAGKIVRRYRKNGYQWYDTPHSGQLTLAINHDKWDILAYRQQIEPRWYHQWFGVKADNE